MWVDTACLLLQFSCFTFSSWQSSHSVVSSAYRLRPTLLVFQGRRSYKSRNRFWTPFLLSACLFSPNSELKGSRSYSTQCSFSTTDLLSAIWPKSWFSQRSSSGNQSFSLTSVYWCTLSTPSWHRRCKSRNCHQLRSNTWSILCCRRRHLGCLSRWRDRRFCSWRERI